jgi:hypothetical protein
VSDTDSWLIDSVVSHSNQQIERVAQTNIATCQHERRPITVDDVRHALRDSEYYFRDRDHERDVVVAIYAAINYPEIAWLVQGAAWQPGLLGVVPPWMFDAIEVAWLVFQIMSHDIYVNKTLP